MEGKRMSASLFPSWAALIPALLLLSAFDSQARMGESPADCDKRYGNPVFTRDVAGGYVLKYYSKNGFLIGVTFKGDVAAAISYSKPNMSEGLLGEGKRQDEWPAIIAFQKYIDRRLNAEEIAYFLDANSEGMKWDLLLKGGVWRRADGAEAIYDYGSNCLSIGSKGYIDFLSGRRQSDLSGL